MKNININRHQGFTIIELMITVTVVGILAAVAMPTLGEIVKNNRIATQTNNIVSALHYARSEAVNRGVNVIIEPLTAGTTWTSGWRVRIDGNNNCLGDLTNLATCFTDAEDIIVRNYDALNGSNLTTGTVAKIIYKPDGQAQTYAANNSVATPRTLTLRANECTGEHKRLINIQLSGSVWLDQNDRSCS